MPPSRPLSVKESRRPYSRPTTPSSTSTDATAKKSRHHDMSSADIKPSTPINNTSAAAGQPAIEPDTKKEKDKDKKRRKKLKDGRVPSSEMEVDGKDVKPSLVDRDRDGGRVMPLTSQPTTSGNTNHLNLPHPQPHVHIHAHPHGHVVPAETKLGLPPTSTSSTKIQKLEGKIERQRNRLKDAEARIAKGQEKAKRDYEKIQDLEARIRVHEEVLKSKQEEAAGYKLKADEHTKTIATHLADKEQLKETLQDAVNCLICADTPRDPHILSCGHIACRDCLVNWFRQPNAYVHTIEGYVGPNRDLSYRSKLCPTCRTTVVRRPTRTYSLYAFLEPLGIVSSVPTISPSQETSDPWANIFPVEKASYRLHDEEDGTARCPNCLHEVYESVCDYCDVEFSEHESDIGSDEEGIGENSDEDSDELPHAGGRGRHARPAGGVRRAQVDIATIEEVLGEDGETDNTHNENEENGSASDGSEDFVTVPTGQGTGSSRRHNRAPRSDHDDEDEQDDDSSMDSPYPYGLGPAGFSDQSADEDGFEYDGAVPRVFPALQVVTDNDESMEETDDEYGGSFIDDGDDEDEGYDLASTGSLHDGEEEDNAMASAAEDLNVEDPMLEPADVAVEVEDDDEEDLSPVPLAERRQRLLAALRGARRRPETAPAQDRNRERGRGRRAQVDGDIDSNDEE